jgi:hypothetical protein
MFEISVFKSRTPPDEVAFFCYYFVERFANVLLPVVLSHEAKVPKLLRPLPLKNSPFSSSDSKDIYAIP